jgi:hypothetical protein
MQLQQIQAEQLQSSLAFYNDSLLEIAPVWGATSTLKKNSDKMSL